MRAVIIGCSSSLGKLLCEGFQARGFSVIGVARTEPREFSGTYLRADISDLSQRKDLIKELLHAGPIDALVFAQRYRGEDEWPGEFELTVNATRALVEGLQPTFSKKCSVVLLSSTAGQTVSLSQKEGYGAARAALLQLMRYYAVLKGPQGVRVNCLSFNRYIKPGTETHHNADEVSQSLAAVTPLRRLATSQDIVRMALFLVDESADFLTGQNIIIDGGLSCISQDSILGLKRLHS